MFNAAVAHNCDCGYNCAIMAINIFGLGRLYWCYSICIYQVSSGKWIGGGDVRLGAVVGLLLGWKLAIVAAVLHMLITLAIFLIFGISQHAEAHKQIRIPSGYIWTLVTIIVYLFGKTILTGLSFA
jgi:Flp pilus assembly protein protease CpaA